MPRSLFRSGVLLALLVFCLPGCGYFQGAKTDAGDDEFADFDNEENAEGNGDEANGDSKTPEGELKLKLKVGDRFPLKKRIEQVLTQGDGHGGVLVNRSIVEMMLSLVVEEVRDGNKCLSVRYHKVYYVHDIAGRQVEYNSERNQPAPTEALVYAGLKDNGFSFWIGPDNRLTELVGFQDFLQRCLQNVPPVYRDAVMRQLEGTQNEDGLANFVDDGIGLLPYSDDPRHPAVAVKVGSTWELKQRRSEGPIPMTASTRCMLKSLTDSTAEISLLGTIVGSTSPVTIRDGAKEMRVLLKSGRSMGSCTVDRRTGLPTQSEVNRFLEMTVQLPDGTEIPQRKEILTSITSYLDQSPGGVNIGMQRDAESDPLTGASGFGEDSGSNRISHAVGTDSNHDTDQRSDSRSRSRTSRGSGNISSSRNSNDGGKSSSSVFGRTN